MMDSLNDSSDYYSDEDICYKSCNEEVEAQNKHHSAVESQKQK